MPSLTLAASQKAVIPLLKPKSTIALVAPSRFMPEDNVTAIANHLHALGYRTVVAPHVYKSLGSLAGSDQERAKGFMEAWQNPQVNAIWCLLGGFGATRILPYLDFDTIASNPKPLIGMSDITVLHAAINQRCGFSTFLGPTLRNFFDDPECPECTYTRTSLWNSLTGKHEFSLSHGEAEVLRAGHCTGVLTGGTLTLIAALMGTPWQLETRDKILLLEDVAEEPYRIDRMLCQLQQGGLFDKVAGVILATWKECVARDPSRSFTLDEIFQHYFGKARFPVIKGFPSGHVKKQITLPLGALYALTSS